MFCYEHNLEKYYYELFANSDSLFIVDSNPKLYEIKEEEKNQALERLKNAFINDKKLQEELDFDRNEIETSLLTKTESKTI